MEKVAKETVRKVIGYTLIVLGFAGLILPILPGWWVILIGLEILGWKLVIHKDKPWWSKFGFKLKNRR